MQSGGGDDDDVDGDPWVLVDTDTSDGISFAASGRTICMETSIAKVAAGAAEG
jgi:hypothetical protein